MDNMQRITNRYESVQAMRLVDLVPLTADPAFVIGADRQLLSVNDAAAALVGQSAAQLEGQQCSAVIAALHPGGERVCVTHDCPVYQAMSHHEPIALGWSSWATPDGRILPITGTAVAAPVDDRESGEVALVIVHVGSAPKSSPLLEIDILGETVVRVRGQRVAVPRRRRAIELLYRLALAGAAGVRRDQLLEELWPDVPLEDSAPRFRVLLHAARQLLGAAGIEDALTRRGVLYLLDTPDLEIDAVAFEVRARGILRAEFAATGVEAVDQALNEYRGELGADERFGDWAAPEVERLRRLYHDLLKRAAQYFAQCGAVDRSVECCQRALRSDPLQEQFQIALIAYYGHLGRREDAMRQYEDYRRLLATEVGADPPAATVRALEQALRTGNA
jgi:DNA-binding SARP family transcriptional activator